MLRKGTETSSNTRRKAAIYQSARKRNRRLSTRNERSHEEVDSTAYNKAI